MGNNHKNSHVSEFKEIKRESNTVLGTISQIVIPPDNDNQFLMKVLHFSEGAAFEEAVLKYTRRKLLYESGVASNLLNVVEIQQGKSSEFCSEIHHVAILMEFC